MFFLEKDSRESFSFHINPVENQNPLAKSIWKSLSNQKTQERRTPWDPRKQMLLHQSSLGRCLDTQEAQPCYTKLNKTIKKVFEFKWQTYSTFDWCEKANFTIVLNNKNMNLTLFYYSPKIKPPESCWLL